MRFLFFLAVLGFSALYTSAQDVRVIQLKQEAANYSPKNYYIINVTDSIPDSVGIGTLDEGSGPQLIVLQDGTATSLKSYIDKSITQDKTQPPIVMNVKELRVDIKKKGTKWSVSIASSLVFYSGDVKLSEFSGNGRSEIATNPMEYLQKEIPRLVQRNMEDFGKWWAQQKDKFAISDQVKVNVSIGKTTENKNFIVYNLKTPLQQHDFKGEVHEDLPEKATTYSGNLFSTSYLVEKGQLVFTVVITPYFDMEQSWFNPVNTNAMLLAHEQAHFDITAIKTCELVNALRNASLTKENYQDRFRQLAQQYENETTDEQNAYDTETNHGTIPDKQQAWQDKITQQVKSCGCY
jgi:hypothetical protein